MARLIIFLLSIISLFLATTGQALASTYNSNIPWGYKNNYRGFDGTDFVYMLTVDPFTLQANSTNVDMVTGACSGPTCYPNDPDAYYNGFYLNNPLTFSVRINNNNIPPNTALLDNFWFKIYKVNSCDRLTPVSPVLATDRHDEGSLADCSARSNLTNQTNIVSTAKQAANIYDGGSVTLTYTWTPTAPGYYQVDFNSDDYGNLSNCDVNGLSCTDGSGTVSHTFHSAFIRVMPNNQTCSVNVQGTASSTDNIPVSFSAYADDTTARTARLWLERANGQVINPAPLNITPSYVNPNNHYLLNSCNSSTAACTGSATVTLPAGNYYAHCDVLSSAQCSGNPFCTFNGGSIDCSGWTQCGPDDSASLTVTASSGVGPLIVEADTANGGVAQGKYGISGLSTADNGGNYYNALSVTQNITNSAAAALEGVAFTAKGGTYNNLSNLMSSAGSSSGNFILLYATSNCTPSCTAGGQTFYPNNYYVYFNGTLNGPYAPGGVPKTLGNIKVKITTFSTPNNPQFSVTFLKNLGSHNWGTYGYIMNSSNQAETVTSEQACNGVDSCY